MAASAAVGSTTGVATVVEEVGVVMVEEGEDGEKMKVEEEQKEKDEECVFIL